MCEIKANIDRLVQIAVQGQISAPQKGFPYAVSHEGEPRVLPGVGGITYNIRVGDQAMGWAADHVEPGVSVKVTSYGDNAGLNILACVGNRARVLSGQAQGAEGVVTGKHGGIEHVLCDFRPSDMEKMAIGDRIQIRGWGQGMELAGCDDLKVMNLGPELFRAMPLSRGEEGLLEVPVVAVIPPELMGSGLGASTASRGDYDLTTADREVLKANGLDHLRFGDLVAIRDTDNSYGRCFRSGAMTIGLVVHSDCIIAGHGPGITTLMTSRTGRIRPVEDPGANIASYLELRSL